MSGPDSLEDARREIARLRALVEVNQHSAELQAMRASASEMHAENHADQLDIIRRSTSWRLTFPFRAAGYVVKRGPALAKRTAEVARKEGLAGISKRLRRRMAGRRKPSSADKEHALYTETPSRDGPEIVAPRVLIVADLTLAQCAKYRVWQKQAGFARLGIACTVLDWHDFERCESALQTHALVIFYRMPGVPDGLKLIAEAKRLWLPNFWEADDLIFDMGHYLANRNLDTLDSTLREEVLAGVDLFRRAMLACDRVIASTAPLAARMREAGAGPSIVIENGLDAATLEAADAVRAAPRPKRGEVVIAYGSGSKAHDADFAQAAPALARVLEQRPQVVLRIIGDLQLPPPLLPWTERIERLPGTNYAAYLGLLGEADISLAPLEDTPFNDAKSNIKWIEASVLGLPSVCSPRATFRDAVIEGETGFLADSDHAWAAALLRLVDEPSVRREVGHHARAAVLRRYAPDALAHAQLAPVVAGLDARTRPELVVLAVNIFFAPVSFGGATIVAEEMAKRLQARADTDVMVFTSRNETSSQYALRRYEWEGVPVFGVTLPPHNVVSEFENPEMAASFIDVLEAVQPDVVHFHAVQNFGAGLLRACKAAGVPYVVTLHDAWWLCARQFMVTEEKSYCFQTKIDLSVCEACVPARHLRQRFRILTHALGEAALLLSPSEAHRRLYLANGFDPSRLLVNQNGIRLPERPRRRPPGEALRFGFVGGISGLKGYHLVQQSFARITASNYELILVDNTLNLGFSTIDTTEWHIAGRLRVAPSYAQDELDSFFDGIDVLLFPSQWKESFGLIVAEALARDVWVIATEGGGAAELIVDGENGSLIPLKNDHRPLQRAVEALLADPERIRRHVNPYKGRLHSYDAQAEELYGLLLRAAGNSAALSRSVPA